VGDRVGRLMEKKTAHRTHVRYTEISGHHHSWSLGCRAGLLTCRSSRVRRLPAPLCRQWPRAVPVPAYSAGPTLRIFTVFPFHPSRGEGHHGNAALFTSDGNQMQPFLPPKRHQGRSEATGASPAPAGVVGGPDRRNSSASLAKTALMPRHNLGSSQINRTMKTNKPARKNQG